MPWPPIYTEQGKGVAVLQGEKEQIQASLTGGPSIYPGNCCGPTYSPGINGTFTIFFDDRQMRTVGAGTELASPKADKTPHSFSDRRSYTRCCPAR